MSFISSAEKEKENGLINGKVVTSSKETFFGADSKVKHDSQAPPGYADQRISYGLTF